MLGRIEGSRRAVIDMQAIRAVLLVGAAAFALCAVVYPALSRAQSFPERPLRLLVGQAPGTATDIVARLVAGKLAELLRQAVVVDNRPGAGESIAADAVAKATPDGYTMLFGSIASHGIAPAIYQRLPYDSQRDFTPLSMVGTTPNVLVVYPGLPVKGLSEFVAYVKSQSGKLNYASTGVGTSTHLGMELFKARMGINIVHVPYKSGPSAFGDLMAGQVAAALFNLPSQLPSIKVGKVRALGVSSLKRSAQLPEIPTIAEAGAPGYEVVVWYAMFAPAGIPRAIQQRLYADLVKAIGSSEIRERSAALGLEATSSTPEQLSEYSRAEIRKWAKVAQDAGVKLE